MPVADVLSAVQDHLDRAPDYDLYRDYEEGRHKYPYATARFKQDFKWVLEQARINVCYAIRSNFTDLVQVQGWSGAGADAAAALAETTDLGMVLDLAVNESWRCGDAHILAWPGKDGKPRPWYHRADQAGFLLDPEDPTEFAVYWKLWVTTDGYGRVNLYYPDRLERWVTYAKVRHDGQSAASWDLVGADNTWAPYAADGEPDVQRHDFGRVPWVHLPFDASAQGGHGRSILRDVIPGQDSLNHAVHSIVVQTEQYAKSTRALMNHEPRTTLDPVTGRVRSEKLDVDETRNSILGFAGAGPLVQLTPPASENVLAVKRAFHSDIANTVGVPISDVIPDLGNVPSGAALRVLAARRTATVRTYTRSIRGRIGDLMALLGVEDAYPEFVDPAPMDETERLAAAQAKLDMGYPLVEVLPDLGEDPDDIARILDAVSAEEARAVAAFRAGQDDPGVMGSGES